MHSGLYSPRSRRYPLVIGVPGAPHEAVPVCGVFGIAIFRSFGFGWSIGRYGAQLLPRRAPFAGVWIVTVLLGIGALPLAREWMPSSVSARRSAPSVSCWCLRFLCVTLKGYYAAR